MTFNDQLSPNFKVQDLTITKHSLATPNLPADNNAKQNLTYLADVLEQLLTHFDFEILSGYRTKELQQKLTAEGEPTSAGLSFHEVGRAVDIYPYYLDLADAFGLILATPELKSRFAEIAYKPSQNSLHLSINVPGDTRTPKVLGLNNAGVYTALTSDDQQTYIERFNNFAASSFEEIPAPNSRLGVGLGIAAALTVGAGLLFLL